MMSHVTDPAAELAKVLDALAPASAARGSAYLAAKFGVEVWSLEFYQIVFSIIQRIEAVRTMLSNLDGFGHLIDDLNQHLDAIKEAFTTAGLQHQWNQHGANHVNKEHIQPLKMCSGFLRSHVSYPELTDEERSLILEIARELLGWLSEHQLEEDDFIRMSLIEGVESFVFRMERLQWLGWGYSLESLQAVVMAYIALERGEYDESSKPNAAAAVKKVGGGLKRVFEVVGISKDIVERADFALRAYGLLMIAVQSPHAIAGLIGH